MDLRMQSQWMQTFKSISAFLRWKQGIELEIRKRSQRQPSEICMAFTAKKRRVAQKKITTSWRSFLQTERLERIGGLDQHHCFMNLYWIKQVLMLTKSRLIEIFLHLFCQIWFYLIFFQISESVFKQYNHWKNSRYSRRVTQWYGSVSASHVKVAWRDACNLVTMILWRTRMQVLRQSLAKVRWCKQRKYARSHWLSVWQSQDVSTILFSGRYWGGNSRI